MDIATQNTKNLFDFQAHLKNGFILSFNQPILEKEYRNAKVTNRVRHTPYYIAVSLGISAASVVVRLFDPKPSCQCYSLIILYLILSITVAALQRYCPHLNGPLIYTCTLIQNACVIAKFSDPKYKILGMSFCSPSVWQTLITIIVFLSDL